MFRMGGPIKEGVMHGIREPHAGGSIAGGHQIGIPMGNRTGFQDPTFWSKLAAQYNPKNFASPKKFIQRINPFKKLKTLTKIPKIAKNTWGILQPKITKGGLPGSTTGQTFMKNLKDFSIPGAARMKGWAKTGGQYMLKRPKRTALGALALSSDPARDAMGYIGENIPGVIKGITPNWIERLIGTEPNKKTEEVAKVVTEPIVEQFKPKVPTVEELANIEAANDAKAASDKDKRLTDLLKIMNYDKSRKNAAYDALIDASEVIRETGFKDKSILPIVKATSARFDKPEQIKEAVGLMMAKGEIEKDIYKSKDSASEQQIQSVMKAYGIDRASATSIVYKQPNNVSQALLVGLSSRGRGTIPTSDTTYSDLYSFLESRNRLDELKGTYNEDDIKDIGGIGKNKTFKTHADVVKDKPDGLYVVEEKVVEVKTGRNPKARVIGG
jgi:hypothetical protein